MRNNENKEQRTKRKVTDILGIVNRYALPFLLSEDDKLIKVIEENKLIEHLEDEISPFSDKQKISLTEVIIKAAKQMKKQILSDPDAANALEKLSKLKPEKLHDQIKYDPDLRYAANMTDLSNLYNDMDTQGITDREERRVEVALHKKLYSGYKNAHYEEFIDDFKDKLAEWEIEHQSVEQLKAKCTKEVAETQAFKAADEGGKSKIIADRLEKMKLSELKLLKELVLEKQVGDRMQEVNLKWHNEETDKMNMSTSQKFRGAIYGFLITIGRTLQKLCTKRSAAESLKKEITKLVKSHDKAQIRI